MAEIKRPTPPITLIDCEEVDDNIPDDRLGHYHAEWRKTIRYYQARIRTFLAVQEGWPRTDEYPSIITEIVKVSQSILLEKHLPAWPPEMPLSPGLYKLLSRAFTDFRSQLKKTARAAILETYRFNHKNVWANKSEIAAFVSLLLTPDQGFFTFQHFDISDPYNMKAHRGIFENPAWSILVKNYYYRGSGPDSRVLSTHLQHYGKNFLAINFLMDANDELEMVRLPSFNLPLPFDVYEDLAQTVGNFRTSLIANARLAVLETYRFNDVSLWSNPMKIRKYVRLLLTDGKGFYTFKHFDNRSANVAHSHSGIFENPAWVALTAKHYYDPASPVADASTRPDLFINFTADFVAINFAVLHHALQEWHHGFFSPLPLDEPTSRAEYLWLLNSLHHWDNLSEASGTDNGLSSLLARLRNDVMDKVVLSSASDPNVVQCTWVDRFV
ncbi:hypothetical protein CALCODRAFT_481307 [Calocera cornea HHB12733]|uniref:DUF6532 domain-containing protein n=1 Tax=Calocera cornea HHB12733 TaxID=1353952 RepID=A0A165HVM0_9BASI|nr:hypothetical protein CALCODRAFT_481307 [Calocera cornea HHB12733]